MKHYVTQPFTDKGPDRQVTAEALYDRLKAKNVQMKGRYLLIICFICFTGCNNSGKIKKSEGETAFTPAEKTAGDTMDIMDSTVVLDSMAAVRPEEPIIYEAIAAQSFPVIKLRKTISSDAQAIHLILTDVDPGQFTISISHSRDDANIRISQIIMPDGTSDGPFGRQLNFYAPQKGNYTIVISKSNMASGSPVGDVFINIEK